MIRPLLACLILVTAGCGSVASHTGTGGAGGSPNDAAIGTGGAGGVAVGTGGATGSGGASGAGGAAIGTGGAGGGSVPNCVVGQSMVGGCKL